MSVDLADVIDEDTAQRVKHASERSWTIQESLTTEYTPRENNPPRDHKITYNCRIKTGGLESTIIEKAKINYKLNSTQETIKKLLRVGLPEIDLEYGDKVERINSAEKAIVITSEYLEVGVFSYADIDEEELNVNSPQKISDQYRIMWYQHFYASSLSEDLNVPKSNVLQLAILLAGRELGYLDEIAKPRRVKIEEEIESISSQLQNKVKKLELLMYGSLFTALTSEYSDEVRGELEQSCPDMLERFVDDVEEVISECS